MPETEKIETPAFITICDKSERSRWIQSVAGRPFDLVALEPIENAGELITQNEDFAAAQHQMLAPCRPIRDTPLD